MAPVVLQTHIDGLPVRRGKVRDVYDLGDRLLIISTDRISAFDWILPNGIPDKGRVLTQISAHWFAQLTVEHHLLSTRLEEMDLPAAINRDELEGRAMLVRKSKVVPIECVVRGYLAGSGWKEYQRTQSVCGVPLPAGLTQASRLESPIFTPATKAESGHDENITFQQMVDLVGPDVSSELRQRSIDIYLQGATHAT
ncbi:MAG: phosphoribosylaminoimidazolesuccinocarboxamide synthase, partial [Planctomycetales bacterium]|nr:phosphoribosylaminoimidazolesuccinocarboxamide synthase [Planctomycetales bacterium]